MLQNFQLGNTEKYKNHLWLIFSLIVFINILFKLINLEYSSFWYDEIISVKSASEDFGHIKHVSEWDKNPPFYYYCLSVWIKLFNDSEFCVRLLSVIFSGLSAGVLYLFSNKHFNKTTAIISSLLFLSSDILFFYSHEARAYSLVLLLSLLSSYVYFNLKNKPSIKNVLLLGLINFLIIYTHYIAGIVIVIQTIMMVFSFETKQKKFFSFSLLILIGLTIIRFTKKQILLILAFNSSENVFWLKKSEFGFLIKMLESFFFSIYLIIPLILITLIGVLLTFKLKPKPSYFALSYCLFFSIGSITIVFFLGKFTPIFLDRYLIFTIPFIFILIAYTFSFIKNKILSISLATAFFIFSAFHINYKTVKAMDYRGVIGFLKNIKTNDDLVIVKTKDVKPLFCYYYEKDFLSLQKKDLPYNENVIFCNSWNDVEREVKNYKRIIIIDSFEDLNPFEAEFVSNLSKQKSKYAIVNYYKGARITFYK
ncbi:MAG: glycosyltransferase family 39 protein [Bacteroidota bacterium]